MHLALEASAIAEPLYIDGSWRPASGATIAVVDPATEETLADVASATAEEVNAALEAANRAQRGWAALSPITRGVHLRVLADVVRAHRDELADILVSEVGKPTSQAEGEVGFAEDLLRFNAEWDRRLEGEILPGETGGEVVHLLRAPIGVVGASAPGTSRWRSSAESSLRRSSPATRWSPSRARSRRFRRFASSG